MKCLELTYTTECLKLAQCLVGSKTDNEWFNQELHGSDYNGFWITDASDDDTWISMGEEKVVLPVEKLKLNPFKCCEHSIPVIVDRGIWGKEKREKKNVLLHVLMEGCTFELDFDKLPNGAKLIDL